MILTVAFYVFVVLAGVQITYYLTFSTVLFKQKKKKRFEKQVPISVIVFSKNNASELEKNLPFILNQKYPNFQVVIVNSASTDHSSEILESFKEKNKEIKILEVENNEAFWGNKKYALTLGIKAAKHDHLLFTDAKSKPLSEFWISEMSKKFTSTKTIILGYQKYKKENSLKNIIFRFDNLLTAIKCFSFAKLGTPFMAYGNNLAYQKEEFFNVKGFINHIKIKDGEDDLFIKDAATKKNISFSISKNSFIEIDSSMSFSSWFQEQKNKKFIKKHYKSKHRFLLSFFTFSKVFFYLLASVLFFFYPWQAILPFVVAYFLVQYIIIGLSAKKLKEVQLLFFLPFLEISLVLIQISIFIANFISKPDHWK